MDRYLSFEELKQGEPPDSYIIHSQEGSSGVAILAPHGGGIEPGTLEIALGIAGTDHTFYAFEGQKPINNHDLHITSTNFNEPISKAIIEQAERVLVIHGCAGTREVVYLGGLDNELKEHLGIQLAIAGFQAEEPSSSELRGENPNNICNRGKNARGIQLEISTGLRTLMFEDLSRRGRKLTTPAFDLFVSSIRKAISEVV